MRIVTWNVNSIRARQDRLVAWLQKHQPDVLCLQELKVEAAKYPHELLSGLGYTSAINAQKTYNGVAILSRAPITDVFVGMQDGVEDPQARLVAGTVEGVRVVCVYVPNGGEMGSDKWHYKLAWLERLRAWLDRHASPDQPLALCGDFNVAPEPLDVHDPAAWEGEVLFHPEARAALRHVTDFGLADTFRDKHPGEASLFSWWDYRMLGFPKNRGLRIDHVFATRPLAARCTVSVIDREERKGKEPSDHAPVVSTFE
jgi:exodeoxyribonuclease III